MTLNLLESIKRQGAYNALHEAASIEVHAAMLAAQDAQKSSFSNFASNKAKCLRHLDRAECMVAEMNKVLANNENSCGTESKIVTP